MGSTSVLLQVIDAEQYCQPLLALIVIYLRWLGTIAPDFLQSINKCDGKLDAIFNVWHFIFIFVVVLMHCINKPESSINSFSIVVIQLFINHLIYYHVVHEMEIMSPAPVLGHGFQSMGHCAPGILRCL